MADKPPSIQPAGDDVPRGVRLMKRLWGITDKPTEREKPPAEVAHDIYRVPDHQTPIPPRPVRRRRRRTHGE